ncbi:MAG: hypothetical protein P9X24_00895, partial [Candidatus Hatepunaea meridiana]|nr:hypothetical protein [Candidatus Hatepunaea meridiana]
VLFGSGLVAGEATLGVLIALFVYGQERTDWLAKITTPFVENPLFPEWLSLIMFFAMTGLLWKVVTNKK